MSLSSSKQVSEDCALFEYTPEPSYGGIRAVDVLNFPISIFVNWWNPLLKIKIVTQIVLVSDNEQWINVITGYENDS